MYEPSDDSFFLSETLLEYLENNKNKYLSALDIGTGSGIQAETLSKFIDKKSILCSDINNDALNYVKKLGFRVITSNLFSKIKGKFDLIAFNPPYLPENKYDKKQDTSGGKKGDEIIIRFLKQARPHLTDSGVIILLLSSLTPRKRILKELDNNQFKAEIIAEKKLFFEQLEVWKISFLN